MDQVAEKAKNYKVTFGPERVRAQLQGSLDGLNGIINQANNSNPDSSQHRGLIASRLPWLHFTGNEDCGGTFSMSWKDSQTGAVHTRQFSMDGDYLGSGDGAEIANSEDFFKSMGQQFIEIAMDSCYENNSWLRPSHMGKTTVSHASSLVETANSTFGRAVA